jgi:hypothetical protein
MALLFSAFIINNGTKIFQRIAAKQEMGGNAQAIFATCLHPLFEAIRNGEL